MEIRSGRGMLPVIPDECREILRRHCFAVEVALRILAAKGLECLGPGLHFHSLADDKKTVDLDELPPMIKKGNGLITIVS